MNIPSLDLDKRLEARYRILVEQHSTPVHPLASGIRALPNGPSILAATQAAWRFFANAAVTLQKLCQPLHDHVRQLLLAKPTEYVLVVHDWSWIDYKRHRSKTDRMNHSHAYAQGDELLNALAVDATSGAPLAPLNLELESAQGVITSREALMQPLGPTHPEALMTQVDFVQALNLPAQCVHVVDREADTGAILRAFAAHEPLCVIRGQDTHHVIYEEKSVSLKALAPRLEYTFSRRVLFHGRQALQYVAEVPIRITRPYIRVREDKREVIPGPPVLLRLVVSEVRSHSGQLLARWYLYTNVPPPCLRPPLPCGITIGGGLSVIINCSNGPGGRGKIGNKRVLLPSPSVWRWSRWPRRWCG